MKGHIPSNGKFHCPVPLCETASNTKAGLQMHVHKTHNDNVLWFPGNENPILVGGRFQNEPHVCNHGVVYRILILFGGKGPDGKAKRLILNDVCGKCAGAFT